MQHDLAYTQSAAPHHLPAGWNFPTMPLQPPAAGAPGQPVMGGGAVDTVARVRWGRLLLVFAGIVLLAFGGWSMSQGSSKSGATNDTTRVVSGGGSDGTNELEIAQAETATGEDTTVDTSGGVRTPGAAPAAAPAVTPNVSPARRTTPRRNAARRTPVRAGARAAGVTAATTAAAAPAYAGPTATHSVRGGGGAPATGELPYTGLETWLAAILGVVLLGGGIVLQVNAVRIAATAMLYRRGILLRPVDCARLAQQRGLPRARVTLSNVLQRLLEEPASGGDFVSARHAH
jgi:hypothetical protein